MYRNCDAFEAIFKEDILIGTVLYELEGGYEDVWRVYNIYEDCLVLRNKEGKKIYESNEDIVKKYGRINPFGVLEISAIKDVNYPHKDLRIGCYTYNRDDDIYTLIGAGVVLHTPMDVLEDEYRAVSDSGFIEFVEEEGSPDNYYDNERFRTTKNFKVGIAYYYGDTEDTLLSFLDDGVLEKYMRKCIREYTDAYGKGFKEDRWYYYIAGALSYSGALVNISGIQDVIFADGDSLEITEDGMFASNDLMDEIFYSIGVPSYPCFITEYKLYMDLNKIKNDYCIVNVLDEDDGYKSRFFIVMTYHSQPKLLSNNSNTSFNHIL